MVLALGSDWVADGASLKVSIGGGPGIRTTVDTGSNGIVMSRKYLGPDVRYPNPRIPFSGFSYSSSDNSYTGEWAYATVGLSSAVESGGPSVTTAEIPIRVVDQMCDKAGRCSADESGTAMMGVGFDRPGMTDPAGVTQSDVNPFLHLPAMEAGTLDPGYLFSGDSLTLGIDDATRSSFTTLQLAPAGDGQWTAPQSCITIGTQVRAPLCGELLLDTGLGYAIVNTPEGEADKQLVPATAKGDRPTVAAGQQVTITVPGLQNRKIYSFTTGGQDAPASVQWAFNDQKPVFVFMNISRHALSQTDYMFDAGKGLMGFRTR